jgi:hypothetical protein
MKKWQFVVLLLAGATVLGATVLRDPIAHAASPFTNVIIGNTADNPVPVAVTNTVKTSAADNPALQPVVIRGFPGATIYTVPAGKELVIDQLSISLLVPDPNTKVGSGTLQILSGSGAGSLIVFEVDVLLASVGFSDLVGSEHTQFYASAGQALLCEAGAVGGGGVGVCDVAGHLVDVP